MKRLRHLGYLVAAPLAALGVLVLCAAVLLIGAALWIEYRVCGYDRMEAW